MNIKRIRLVINALSFIALIVALTIKDSIISFVTISVCLVFSVIVLLFNINILSESSSSSENKTIKIVTIFDLILFLSVILIVVFVANGILKLTENEESILASIIITVVILVLGNISPKLPRTRHTGLRLPWTIADEETWVLAHRTLGYISTPIASCNIIALLTSMNPNTKAYFSCGSFFVWVAIPSVLSLIFYIKKMKRNL